MSGSVVVKHQMMSYLSQLTLDTSGPALALLPAHAQILQFGQMHTVKFK